MCIPLSSYITELLHFGRENSQQRKEKQRKRSLAPKLCIQLSTLWTYQEQKSCASVRGSGAWNSESRSQDQRNTCPSHSLSSLYFFLHISPHPPPSTKEPLVAFIYIITSFLWLERGVTKITPPHFLLTKTKNKF